MPRCLLWATDAQPVLNQKMSSPLKPPLFPLTAEHDAECHGITLLLVRATCLVVSPPSLLSAHQCTHCGGRARAREGLDAVQPQLSQSQNRSVLSGLFRPQTLNPNTIWAAKKKIIPRSWYFKELPCYLHTQLRVNETGKQRGPSHAKHFRWERASELPCPGHLVSMWVLLHCDLFRRPASVTWTLLASSCPSLEPCHLSLSENLLGGIYCPVQPSQPTAHGFLLL